MQGKRTDRVNQLLKEEAADILRTELKDPRIGFATVTEVEVSKDLRHAKVYVSVLGPEEAWQSAFKALTAAEHFVRGQLRRRLRLRIIPEVSFCPDRSMAHAAQIQRVIERLKAESAADSADSE